MDIDFAVEVARLRWHHAPLRFEISMLRHAQALRKKYDPSQPRVAAGNSDGGQWTRGPGGAQSASGFDGVLVTIFQESGDGSLVLSDANPDPLIVGAQYAQAQNTIDYSNSLTGISRIDTATTELSGTLARVMDAVNFIPAWTPQVYGTAVHVAFGISVRMQGIPGIAPTDVEQSFIGEGTLSNYGRPGSVRTDVVLRSENGAIMAIYDVKTGGALLTAARARELRAKTGTGSNTPIIELHVLRGATLKGFGCPHGLVRSAIESQRNPYYPDNFRQEEAQERLSGVPSSARRLTERVQV
jgi:hypothetical protein